MLVSKLDVDDVVAWLGGLVGDAARAVLVIMALNVSLAGALDGQGHAAVAWAQK